MISISVSNILVRVSESITSSTLPKAAICAYFMAQMRSEYLAAKLMSCSTVTIVRPNSLPLLLGVSSSVLSEQRLSYLMAHRVRHTLFLDRVPYRHKRVVSVHLKFHLGNDLLILLSLESRYI